MRSLIFIPLLALFGLLIISGCTKNTDPIVKAVKPVAVAPKDTALTLPTNSITLTGSGTVASGSIIGYLWSQVSGPAEASMVNEGSATVTLKGLIAGKYLFQFMVTDNKGLTGLDTVYVTVNPAKIVNLTLAPTNNPTESIAGLLGSADESSTGTIEEPLCAWTIGGEPITVRGLLKFDLSSIPSTATITKANLVMYSDTIPKNGDLIHANYGIDNSILIQQVATAWDPAALNWYNQPDGLTANQIVLPSTTDPFLNINVDVKAIVSAMVSNNANYGFKLKVINEVLYTSRIFCSSYYPVASRHPQLIITYQVK
jgi:hypothetical protein